MAHRLTTPNGSGPLLEAARLSRGTSLEDMAGALGIEPADLETIEREGISGSMGVDEFAAVCHAYGMTMEEVAEQIVVPVPLASR